MDSKVFGVLLILAMVVLAFELVCPYTIMHMEENALLNTIVNKIYLFCCYVWGSMFLLYIVLIIYGADILKKFNKKYWLIYVLLGFSIITPILCVFVPKFEYVGGINGMPYTITGLPMFMYYGYIVFGSFVTLYLLAANDEKVRKLQLRKHKIC